MEAEEGYNIFDYYPTWYENGIKSEVLQISKLPSDESLASNIKKMSKCETVPTNNFQNLRLCFNNEGEFGTYVHSLPENKGKADGEIIIPELVITSVIENNCNTQINNLCKLINEKYTANLPDLNTALRESLFQVDEKISPAYLFPKDCADGPYRAVEKINLAGNPNNATEIISHLELFPTCKYLNLSKAVSGDASFTTLNEKLVEVPNLLYLNIAATNCGPSGAGLLTNISKLHYLYALILTENNITDVGMKSIRDAVFEGKLRLSQLDINKNGLSIEGFKFYKEILNHSLVRTLDLSNTSLSSEILETVMSPETLQHF